MSDPKLSPLPGYCQFPPQQMQARAAEFLAQMRRRRSVRQFSDRPVRREIVEDCIRTAGSAPSGANRQPWHFVAVSDPAVKRKIRLAAEQREREFYERLAPQPWLEAIAPLGTGPEKPFLETAPWLIVIFHQRHGRRSDEQTTKSYYGAESVGIATGLLIAAIHNAGLASLVYTPTPMGFLNEILDRPANERPFLILVVGYPAENALVPDIRRKQLDEIATFL